MKIYIFGSCSGTEPMEGRHHTAFAIEINGKVYWFDAGENCSHTAHLMGVDLLSVSDIFISHPHIDHVGGLANLLANVNKLSYVKNTIPNSGDITVHMPNDETFDGVMAIMKNSDYDYDKKYKTIKKRIKEGVIFKDENISVEALHNNHMPKLDDEWVSYSFLIEAEGKRIIYSGDVRGIDDLVPFIHDGCDALFMETGHHFPENVCQKIVDSGYDVKNLYFLHHGRKILYDYEGELTKCHKIIPTVTICNDKDIYTI